MTVFQFLLLSFECLKCQSIKNEKLGTFNQAWANYLIEIKYSKLLEFFSEFQQQIGLNTTMSIDSASN